MPHVNDQKQLGRRDLLGACWRYVPEAIGLLAPKVQWELHHFYALSHDLTDEEFLDRMRQVVAIEPSLA
jgi:hypothetical protein